YDGEEVYSITGHFSDWNIEWVKTMPLNGGSDSRLFVFNNIVWLSVDGKGLVFSDIKKSKFDHYTLISNGSPANTRSFKQDIENNYWFSSRDNGIGKFDKNGNLLKQYNKYHKNSPTDLILAIETLDNGDIIGVGGNHFVEYNKQ